MRHLKNWIFRRWREYWEWYNNQRDNADEFDLLMADAVVVDRNPDIWDSK